MPGEQEEHHAEAAVTFKAAHYRGTNSKCLIFEEATQDAAQRRVMQVARQTVMTLEDCELDSTLATVCWMMKEEVKTHKLQFMGKIQVVSNADGQTSVFLWCAPPSLRKFRVP